MGWAIIAQAVPTSILGDHDIPLRKQGIILKFLHQCDLQSTKNPKHRNKSRDGSRGRGRHSLLSKNIKPNLEVLGNFSSSLLFFLSFFCLLPFLRLLRVAPWHVPPCPTLDTPLLHLGGLDNKICYLRTLPMCEAVTYANVSTN